MEKLHQKINSVLFKNKKSAIYLKTEKSLHRQEVSTRIVDYVSAHSNDQPTKRMT